MAMKYIIALLLACWSFHCSSQSFVWADEFDGYAYYTTITDVDMDKIDRVANCGYVQYHDSPTLDVTTPYASHTFTTADGTLHGFLSMLNTDGSLAWMVNFMGDDNSNSIASAVKVDHSHKCLYVVGAYSGGVDFNGDNVPDLTSTTKDGFLAQYKLNGVLNWVISIGGNGNHDYARDVTVDPTGNVYVIGIFTDIVDFDPSFLPQNRTAVSTHSYYGDVYVARYGWNSSYHWVSVISPDNAANGLWAYSIDWGLTADAIYLVLQAPAGSYDVNPMAPILWESSPSSIISLKAAGGTYLTHTSTHDAFTDVVWDRATGDVFAIGHESWTVKTYRKTYDLLPVWDRTLPNASSLETDLACDRNEQLWVAGRANGIDLDPGTGSSFVSTGGFFASYLKSNGDLMCYGVIGSHVDDAAYAVKAANLNIDVSVGGIFNQLTDFDPSPSNFMYSPTEQDAYVAHYTDCHEIEFGGGSGMMQEPTDHPQSFDVLGRPIMGSHKGWVYQVLPDGTHKAIWVK